MENADTHTATNTADTRQPTVRTRALSAGYHGRTVLDGIDLALPRATLAVLIGANGSGKSTLLRTLAGAQPPLRGTVEICGDDIRALSRRSLAQRLAVVFTDRSGGGALTVRECAEMGRHPYTGLLGRLAESDRHIVDSALRSVGMLDKADRYLGTLSDGERQKTMIARALAQQTPFIILDEPTAFLDVAGRIDILRLLRTLADSGHTILLSSHDTAQAIAASDTLLAISDSTLHWGQKADIIASGVLDATFRTSGLRFDPVRGDFT